MTRLATTLVVLAVAAIAVPSMASAVEIEIGLEGHFRIGQWTPVRVTEVSDGPVAILCTDPTGLVVKYPLEKQGDQHVGLVQFANVTSRCMIVSGDNDTPVAKFVPSRQGVGTAHRSSERVWLIDTDDIDFGSARDRLNEFADEFDRATVVVTDLAETVHKGSLLADALDAVNLVVLTRPVRDEISIALRRWVADGGHLLIAGGFDESFASESPLAGWLPVRVDGVARFRDLNVLEASVPSGRNLRLKRPLNGVRLVTDDGNDEIKSSFGPILVRAPYGFGRVSAFALELSEPVFQDWSSLPAMCLILADENLQSASTARQSQTRLTRTGVSEFETQLLATVDNATDAGRTQMSLWQILGRLLLYGFVIAAVDYVLVHKLLRVPQLTWLTMPAWSIGIFCFVTMSPAGSVEENSGGGITSVSTTSLSVCDVDATTGNVKLRSFISLGVDKRTRVAPELNPAFAVSVVGAEFSKGVSEERLGWTAPPEENFGGRYRSQQIDLGGLSYLANDNRNGFDGIPVEPKGTRLFESSRRIEPTTNVAASTGAESLVEFDVELRGVRPIGKITSRLPGKVENWSFAIGRQMVFPREPSPLIPNVPFIINLKTCDSRPIRDVVTGIRRGVDEDNTSATGGRTIAERDEYDPASLNPIRALVTATFFERSGGLSFAGIRDSGSPGGFDLSHILEFNKVVFLGKLSAEVSPVELVGSEDSDALTQYSLSFVRVVCPLIPPE